MAEAVSDIVTAPCLPAETYLHMQLILSNPSSGHWTVGVSEECCFCRCEPPRCGLGTMRRSLTGCAPRLDVGAPAANFTIHIWGINGQACAILEVMGRVASIRDSDTVAAYRP